MRLIVDQKLLEIFMIRENVSGLWFLMTQRLLEERKTIAGNSPKTQISGC